MKRIIYGLFLLFVLYSIPVASSCPDLELVCMHEPEIQGGPGPAVSEKFELEGCPAEK